MPVKKNTRKPAKKTGKKGAKSRKKKTGSIFNKLFITVFVVLLALIILYALNKKQLINKSSLLNIFDRLTSHVDELTTPMRTISWKATLYFADESSDYFIKEFRSISSVKNPEKMSEVLLNELIKGPEAKGVRTIPEQTRLLDIELLNDGLIIVDLSKEFTEHHPGGSSTEIMTVYSIVNTLTTNIKDVRMVRIIQEGSRLNTIAGHIDCNKTFYPDLKLIR